MPEVKIKNSKEIEIMREGGKILSDTLRKLSEKAQAGITTQKLEELARELVLSHGVKGAFLGYDGYPAVLCTSINDEIVHAIPSDRQLMPGDILKLDMGILHKGFYTDAAVTVLIPGGENSQLKNKLLNVTREALSVGIATAKMGRTIGDIG
jgi:methionyl aminopeptidase